MTADEAIETFEFAIMEIDEHNNDPEVKQSNKDVYEAFNIAIKAIKSVERLKRLCRRYEQKGDAPTSTISIEELRGFIGNR